MVWNYRVMRRAEKSQPNSFYYSIVEAYYNNPGDEPPQAWTVGNAEPIGDTLKELKEDITLMFYAFDRPILDETEMEISGLSTKELNNE